MIPEAFGKRAGEGELMATIPVAAKQDSGNEWLQQRDTKISPTGSNDAVQIILANAKLLVLGPALAALVAFGIASFLPKSYTSAVYLRLDEGEARAADALMQSIPVIDRVLAEYTPPEATLDARRTHIEKNRRIVLAAGETQKTSKLFRMEYSDRNPTVAQRVSSRLIAAWLESTKPPPDKRAAIEAEIERTEIQAKAITQLIERLEKDAPSLVAAQSLQGELATPIASLLAKRDENLASLIRLKNSLKGLSEDVVFGTPSLPDVPSWPNRGILVILTTVVTALLLIVFVILRRFGLGWPRA
jgi:hypothetical protein